MQGRESQEDYLERILMLQQKGPVRSVDVARALSVSKPSVSVAMKLLKQKGLIEMDEHNLITLTDDGLVIAQQVLQRHRALSQFLMGLGVEEETAFKDACRMEHVISQESFQAVCRFIEQNQQDGGRDN